MPRTVAAFRAKNIRRSDKMSSMNNYRIKYKKGESGANYVEADSVNGFDQSCDTYLFKIDGEIVAVIPKANVISVVKVAVE